MSLPGGLWTGVGHRGRPRTRVRSRAPWIPSLATRATAGVVWCSNSNIDPMPGLLPRDIKSFTSEMFSSPGGPVKGRGLGLIQRSRIRRPVPDTPTGRPVSGSVPLLPRDQRTHGKTSSTATTGTLPVVQPVTGLLLLAREIPPTRHLRDSPTRVMGAA